jgi:hypothetical protein
MSASLNIENMVEGAFIASLESASSFSCAVSSVCGFMRSTSSR